MVLMLLRKKPVQATTSDQSNIDTDYKQQVSSHRELSFFSFTKMLKNINHSKLSPEASIGHGGFILFPNIITIIEQLTNKLNQRKDLLENCIVKKPYTSTAKIGVKKIAVINCKLGQLKTIKLDAVKNVRLIFQNNDYEDWYVVNYKYMAADNIRTLKTRLEDLECQIKNILLFMKQFTTKNSKKHRPIDIGFLSTPT